MNMRNLLCTYAGKFVSFVCLHSPCIYISVYTYVCAYTYIHIYVRVYMCMCIYVHVYLCVYAVYKVLVCKNFKKWFP